METILIRRSSAVPTGPNAQASQLQSQQSQQSFSQGLSSQHGMFSQLSQNSLNEALTNDQVWIFWYWAFVWFAEEIENRNKRIIIEPYGSLVLQEIVERYVLSKTKYNRIILLFWNSVSRLEVIASLNL